MTSHLYVKLGVVNHYVGHCTKDFKMPKVFIVYYTDQDGQQLWKYSCKEKQEALCSTKLQTCKI